MRWWKWIGLAGLVGAAAAGAVVVNRRRARTWNDYDADELRARLHTRLAESRSSDGRPVTTAAEASTEHGAPL